MSDKKEKKRGELSKKDILWAKGVDVADAKNQDRLTAIERRLETGGTSNPPKIIEKLGTELCQRVICAAFVRFVNPHEQE